MGRFHQPEKFARAAAAVNPVAETVPAADAAPAPEPRGFDARFAMNRSSILRVEGSNPLAQIGYLATLVYMFGVYCLSEELAINFLGFKPYLTTVTGIVALMAAVLSGGISKVFTFPPAKLMLCFCAWLLVAVPFSTWRGGSWDTVTSYMTKSLVVMIFLLMTVTTWKQVRLVFYAMTAAALILTLAVRTELLDLPAADARLSFGTGGRLGNPNDLATHMLTMLPFVVGLFFLSSRFSLLRPISALVSIGTFYTVLHTGSRGALVTVLVMGVVLVWKLPNAVHKLALVVLAFILAAAAVTILPGSVVQRYKLLFANAETVPSNIMESQALESSESRRAILIRSLEVTAANPVFGVGPGNFATAEAGVAREEGHRGAWLQTHNSYTQVSSECGVPAFLLYAAAILASIGVASRYHKRVAHIPEFQGEAVAFLVILMSLVSFAVNTCFSSLAYTFYIPSLVGILGSLVLVVNRDLAIYEKRQRGAHPAPVAVSPFGPMFNPRRLNAN